MKKILILFVIMLICFFSFYQIANADDIIGPTGPLVFGCHDGAQITDSNNITIGGYRYVCEVIVWHNESHLRFASDGNIDGVSVSGIRTSKVTVENANIWWVFVADQTKTYIPIILK